MTDKQNWCQCEPTRCEGVGRCRWQAMDYRPGEARRQADRAEGFGADCLKIRVAMGLGLHSHDDLVEAAAALREDAERYRWLRNEAHDWEDAKIVNLYAGPDYERKSGEELDAIVDCERLPKTFVLGAA